MAVSSAYLDGTCAWIAELPSVLLPLIAELSSTRRARADGVGVFPGPAAVYGGRRLAVRGAPRRGSD
ncbi:hypothetical protein NDU88_008196 [Pleurodeles waltl]|uniref:Uncharacterized protein n=1 Tax=Pleurodeles waltl TaxID=8319 RepID=A0AAV7N496_PLEWA|nr:hypothetical protein NDU88_008196 [Pleurodeles waltl]